MSTTYQNLKDILSSGIYEYFFSGADDSVTLRENELSWKRFQIVPRVMSSPRSVSLEIDFFEKKWPSPFLVAPMAYLGMVHEHGDLGVALASAAQQFGFILSCHATTPLELISSHFLREELRGPLWFQFYPYGSHAEWLSLISRVQRAGYEALVVTVDAPVKWTPKAAIDAGFSVPANCPQPNLSGVPPRGSLTDVLKQAFSWNDLKWLREKCSLPIVIKGVLNPEDASRLCDESLCDAIIVSNHGGRVIDRVIPTAYVLKEIVASVANRVKVLVDSGIRSAHDVAVALALGADAVLIGRPVVAALAEGGAQGVAHLFSRWRDELSAIMAVCGFSTISDFKLNIDIRWSKEHLI